MSGAKRFECNRSVEGVLLLMLSQSFNVYNTETEAARNLGGIACSAQCGETSSTQVLAITEFKHLYTATYSNSLILSLVAP